MKIYDFQVKDRNRNMVDLGNYRGKVLLIVNTATKCGFTKQYEGLESLYLKYKSKGFEILDFPCNQFAKQAPGSDEEIQSFCTLNYHTTFPRFSKVCVNGVDEEPLYHFLKNEQKGVLGASIKWNFTKFLIDRDGKVIARFSPATEPEKLEKEIEALL